MNKRALPLSDDFYGLRGTLIFSGITVGVAILIGNIDKNAPPREIRKNIEEVITADGKLERTVTTLEGYQYVFKKCYDRLNDSDDGEVVCVYNLNLRGYCKLAEKEKNKN